MGCPDWPKCFGQWVPPTSIEQLPEDYKDHYATIRDKKNQKFARYLTALGMDETADRILTDTSILEEPDFNPLKTRIEYVNRLVGVVIGLLIIAVFIRSIRLIRVKPLLFWLSLTTLVVVIFQGWFGSIVVSTNLTAWTITIHMLLAILVVALLIMLMNRSAVRAVIQVPLSLKVLLGLCMLLLVIQILLGTEVRSAIDAVASTGAARGEWISLIWQDFVAHRSFSWVVLFVHIIFIARLRKTTGNNPLSLSVVLLILLTILSGAGMGYFSMPAFLQPIHLLIATLTFGVQFLLFLRLNTTKTTLLAN